MSGRILHSCLKLVNQSQAQLVLPRGAPQHSISTAVQALSTGPTTQVPQADVDRAGTADLCDIHVPDPVDIICERKVQIVEPIFRYKTRAFRVHPAFSL